MRIAIVLPGVSRRPVGGFRVPYGYANRLDRRGHDVVVHHELPEARQLRHATCLLERIPRSFVTSRTSWFDVADSVEIRVGPPRAWRPGSRSPDVVLLTSWSLGLDVGTRYRPSTVVQLVHDFEFWADGDEQRRALMARALGHRDVRYVATSSAVVAMLEACGTTPAAVVPAGIDRAVYFAEGGGPERGARVGVLLRSLPHKGTADALDAFRILRGAGVQLDAVGAGAGASAVGCTSWPAPDDASMRRFYSSLAVFVLPSHQEAWGLPALEAMACGAAVVLVDNVGCRDFAEDGRNCMLVPPRRPDLIAAAVGRLLDDAGLRRRLAEDGRRTVESMDWDVSVRALEAVLAGASGPRA